MIKVRPRPLSEYFRASQSSHLAARHRKATFFSRRQTFNKVTLLTALEGACLFFGFWDHRLWLLGLAGVLVLVFLHRRLWHVARRITLTRHPPDQANRFEMIEVLIEVTNGSRRPVRDILIRDHFNGSTEPQALVWMDSSIRSGQRWTGSYTKKCDAGTGSFVFSELEATMTDPLGIFEILISESTEHTLLIYPAPVTIPQLPITPVTFQESFAHGLYDSPRKGTFANFAGIRDYVRGDSLRHISWKASAKASARSPSRVKFMVKEFESVCNTDLSLFLDMRDENHAGNDRESSWECAKDAALALLAQQLNNGNRVQVFSQNLHVPLGGSAAHASLAAKRVFTLRPVKDAVTGELGRRYLASVPDATVVIYIRAVFPGELSPTQELIDTFKRFLINDTQVFCILIDSASFIRGSDLPGASKALLRAILDSAQEVELMADRLRLAGVRTYVLERDRNLGEALIESQQHHDRRESR